MRGHGGFGQVAPGLDQGDPDRRVWTQPAEPPPMIR